MSDLAKLGLSSYEEQVYRALLRLGSATAQEISTTSDVPMGRIYDILNNLNARDLIQLNDTQDPTQYIAIDPDIVIDRLLAERKRELADRRERYEEIATAAGDELTTAMPTESRFWTAGLGSEEALSLITEQFETAHQQITSVVGVPYQNGGWERYKNEIDAIAEQLRPDLTVQVLVSEQLAEHIPQSIQHSVFTAPSVEVRTTSSLHATFDVVDDQIVYVHMLNPFNAGERLGVVAVRDTAFATRLQTAFKAVWAEATPVISSPL